MVIEAITTDNDISADEERDEDIALWTIGKTAEYFLVDRKTVSRLIEKGALQAVRVGRCIRIERQAIHHFINSQQAYTVPGAGLAVRNPKGARSCLKSAREGKGLNVDLDRRTGGPLTATQAVREFNALLGRPTRGKR